ncbi:MAG: hypothetical protein ABSG78_14515 [Verrucomicrobiota bacterium]|jgi:DNA-directed RNA polymerase subunit RPC12/RpoP
MSQYKYACPYCGQRMEYTDAHSGLHIACPKCQHPIVLPAIPAGKLTTSLRVVRPVAPSAAKFQFTFAGIVLALRGFKHWKIAGMCLVPFVLVAGALVAASVYGRHEAAPPAAPAGVVVDPEALDTLTDLTRADQLVQDELAAVNRAFAVCQDAETKQAALHNQHREAAGPATFQAVDEAANRAHQALADARKDFDKAFAHYQKLGGAIDYRRQLP